MMDIPGRWFYLFSGRLDIRVISKWDSTFTCYPAAGNVVLPFAIPDNMLSSPEIKYFLQHPAILGVCQGSGSQTLSRPALRGLLLSVCMTSGTAPAVRKRERKRQPKAAPQRLTPSPNLAHTLTILHRRSARVLHNCKRNGRESAK